MRSIHENFGAVTALAPDVYDADDNGVTVDRLGYESLAFVLAIGVGGITFSGSNKIEFTLEESANGSDWTDVVAEDVVGVTIAANGIVKTLNAAHAAATVTRFSYIGNKRYVRLSPDFTGTHGAGTPIAATAILGRPHSAPIAA